MGRQTGPNFRLLKRIFGRETQNLDDKRRQIRATAYRSTCSIQQPCLNLFHLIFSIQLDHIFLGSKVKAVDSRAEAVMGALMPFDPMDPTLI